MIGLLPFLGFFGGVNGHLTCKMAEPPNGEIVANIDSGGALKIESSSLGSAKVKGAFRPEYDVRDVVVITDASPMERFKWSSESERITTVLELSYFQKGASSVLIYEDDHRGRHHYMRQLATGTCTVTLNSAGGAS